MTPANKPELAGRATATWRHEPALAHAIGDLYSTVINSAPTYGWRDLSPAEVPEIAIFVLRVATPLHL